MSRERTRSKPAGLPIIHPFAAGIDIGARFHVVAVSPDLCDEPVQTFQAFTSDLQRMANWLVATGTKTVVMESTGVYWVAAYKVLEARGALVGNYQPEHLFALKQALALYDFYQRCIEECDAEIERTVAALNLDRPIPEAPLPKPKHRSKMPSDPGFDARQALYQLTGTDLAQIHGIGPFLALRLVGECGTDLSRWPTAKHFTSWLTLSSGCKISGGKVIFAHTRKTSNRVTVGLRLAAVTVGKSHTTLGAFCRRLAARIGNAKAVTATARKIAVLFYNAMRFGMDYRDLGADYCAPRITRGFALIRELSVCMFPATRGRRRFPTSFQVVLRVFGGPHGLGRQNASTPASFR